MLKTWFAEGQDDPRLTVINVRAETGYYWDTKHGNAIAGVKLMNCATIGKTMDDSIKGKPLPRLQASARMPRAACWTDERCRSNQ